MLINWTHSLVEEYDSPQKVIIETVHKSPICGPRVCKTQRRDNVNACAPTVAAVSTGGWPELLAVVVALDDGSTEATSIAHPPATVVTSSPAAVPAATSSMVTAVVVTWHGKN